MTTTNPHQDPDAVKAEGLANWPKPEPYKYFEGRRWLVEARIPIAVMVGELQHPDGRVQREITVSQVPP
jgi:hypothetical protein